MCKVQEDIHHTWMFTKQLVATLMTSARICKYLSSHDASVSNYLDNLSLLVAARSYIARFSQRMRKLTTSFTQAVPPRP